MPTHKDLGFASYADYLDSDHWKEFKASYRASGRSMKCAVCGCGPIQLHHHTYERIGRELLTDVTPLCRPHHEAVHDWLKARKLHVAHTAKAVAALSAAIVAGPTRINTKVKKKKKKQKQHKKTRSEKLAALLEASPSYREHYETWQRLRRECPYLFHTKKNRPPLNPIQMANLVRDLLVKEKSKEKWKPKPKTVERLTDFEIYARRIASGFRPHRRR